jgi:hypothetical protein
MRSDREVRMVEAQTPPFKAVAIVKAQDLDAVWAQARAEAMLLEQIGVQIGGHIASLEMLKKMGVYTVDYSSKTQHYIHCVEAPDGITFTAVEEVPRWWEAADTIPMDRIPNGHALTISLLPTLSMDQWRQNAWPDRPHP